MLNFTPSDVTFYEADTKMILILDKKDPERKVSGVTLGRLIHHSSLLRMFGEKKNKLRVDRVL